MTIEHLIQRNLTRAVTAFFGRAWTHNLTLEVALNTDVCAFTLQASSLCVHVSTGFVTAFYKLQKDCPAKVNVERALEWLFLHELHHVELGHFKLLDGVPVLNLVSRATEPARPLRGIPQSDWPDVSPCLELQADHEAIEMVLGSFDVSDWSGLRVLAASISAVMVLIEKADEALDGQHSTHPKAATRIFQLLGHVSEMWAIQHQLLGQELPSNDQIQSFSKDVILPAYFDAVALAKAAEAKNIASDLGEADVFFADIARAKLGDWDALQTVGAQEWARLKPLNEKLLPMLPLYADAT